MSAKIEIKGIEPLERAFAKGASGELKAVLKDKTPLARRRLVERLTDYPPERSGQRYQRTYRLRRGWERSTPVVGAFGLQLVNATEYAQFVQGAQQARMHQGRWLTVDEIARQETNATVKVYEQAAEQWARGVG